MSHSKTMDGTSTSSKQKPIEPPNSPFGIILPEFLSTPFFGITKRPEEPNSTWRDCSNNEGSDIDEDMAKPRIEELEMENISLKERLNATTDKQEELSALLKAEKETVKYLQQQLAAAKIVNRTVQSPVAASAETATATAASARVCELEGQMDILFAQIDVDRQQISSLTEELQATSDSKVHYALIVINYSECA